MRRMQIEASIPGPMYMSMEGGGDEKRMQQASLLFSKFPTRVGPASSSTSSIDPALPMVRVCLSVDYRVHSRQMLCVGGSAIPLGWSFLSIAKVPMCWEPEDRWVVEFELPVGSKLEYKYVILEEQDWTQQMNAATEGMVEYSYRVQPEVNPPDVQKITRRMAIVAWQSGKNRVLHVPSEEEILSAQQAGVDGLWREFDGKVGGAQAPWNASANSGSSSRSNELCWERLFVEESGQPSLDRQDVWGIEGTSPFR